MDVLFCSVNDWANVGVLFARALQSVGVDAMSVARYPHPFDYLDKDVLWKSWDELQALADKAKTVVLMHSETFNKLRLKNKRVAVFHGGTRYRKGREALNAIFNEFCDVALIQTADLFNSSARNPVWIIPPVDIHALRPKPAASNPGGGLVYAHYPSNPKVKGTEAIMRTMRSLNVDFRCETNILPHDRHLRRIADCDVYVEQLALEQPGGYLMGIWSMSALEAAALGKVVIANDLWRREYEEVFGPCPILKANNHVELAEIVKMLQEMPRSEIEDLKVTTRKWVVEKHSFVPVGTRLKECLCG